MADDSKNQDPEEEKNQSSNEDDFGLSDFEFDELEDDDDDEAVSTPEEPVAEEPPKASDPAPEKDSGSDEDVPSMDADDLEGIDLEGIEDVELSDQEDLGDLDLENIDMDDLDLGDLDKELKSLEEEVTEPKGDSAPEPVTADRVEDIFDEPAKDEKGADSVEEPVGEIEDDGLFYEEESFDDFDFDEDGSSASDKSDTPPAPDKESAPDSEETEPEMELGGDSDGSDSGLDMELGDALDDSDLADFEGDSDEASTFDGDDSGLDMDFGGDTTDSSVFDEDETPDVEFEDGDEAVPFSQRPVEGAEGLAEPVIESDNYSEEVTEEEATGAKSKFVKIVVIGTVLFVAIGFGFLYLNDSLPFGDSGDASKKVAKTETKKPAKKSADKNTASKAKADPDSKKATTTKKTDPKAKKTTPKKKTTTSTKKPVAKTTTAKKPARSTAGVTTLSSKTGESHLIAGSFADSKSAKTYASKLVARGESPTIIPPFGTSSNYRVALASYASWSIAETNLGAYRTKFGSSVWILRY